MVLKEELGMTVMNESEPIDTDINTIEGLNIQLNNIGNTINTRVLIQITLRGSPQSKTLFRKLLSATLQQFSALTFADFIGHLQAKALSEALSELHVNTTMAAQYVPLMSNTSNQGRGCGSRGRGGRSGGSGPKCLTAITVARDVMLKLTIMSRKWTPS
uniref:Uncharacterized protein n=1 Tax=Physcomitrium patens TaxID=3218 RepID=A0A2K1KWT6_PHYPA|nr:hypothetical protein PHYPA_005205 [Physcomitrium patens]